MTALTIAVASGKGGTGKTSVAASLALAAPSAQYIDCDVETPNGHLFLHPEIRQRGEVRMRTPQIDADSCTLCGECAQACEFNALAVTRDKVLVFAELCHGCGVCSYVCRVEGAITEVQRGIGLLEMGESARAGEAPLQFAKGTLNIGETGSVGVIKAVKQYATHDGLRVLDAPAGTACPMVETVQGVDYCLLVTEPTPFGLHDLKLAVEVVRRLGVPCGVVLNRCDIGDDRVKDYCQAEEIPLLMEIPFERGLAEAYARGIPWVEARPEYRDRFQGLVRAIQEELDS
ncbi:(4Fe-4S)-binding protein [Thiorhodococcus mannitoliphagus]|uniref:(4Fe-4S)-binding protein n=1 Tax=Thiorhodococcus mannitoliphagus TaxID=329406 RepID=A0A6P1DRU7_9GAMM|nr:ATP-binding protein [Thiorhodococcus mannitoliphagus]NEX20270.1 (4Fe-4S)-binding protein [Thiorhodococcus mannitoliphagus]